ncbi:MAG: 6,7-dimethyl-8-ribityllumazine synthase [Thermoguttaceae bacterium]|nr:6,7-dimethyl-8-ribityllumazine synthase [Thermoguttaceae bacterium]
MTEYEGFPCAPGDVGKIAIVVSKFNRTITDRLLEGALAKLRQYMVAEDQITVVRVPGAFELPTLAQRFASDEEYAAVICLGCVIKGETRHDEYINSAVSAELARIGSEYCLPVIFGVLTCDTVQQAEARSGVEEVGKDKTLGEQPGNKGAEAAEAALEMLDLLGKLPELYDPEEDEKEFSSLSRNSDRYVRGDFETVDVDPDSLEEIDDEDDEDGEPWFVHGGKFGSKEPFGRQEGKGRSGKSQFKGNEDRREQKGRPFDKSKSHKQSGHDKKHKKDGGNRGRK